MKSTNEETAAYQEGFRGMMESLRKGDLNDAEGLRKELDTLFSLSKEAERVTYVGRREDLEIDRTVSTVRTRAQVPAQRFFGEVSALVQYAKACRAKGLIPQDVKFDGDSTSS